MSDSKHLYWCPNCNVPLLNNKCENCGVEGFKICSDLKPMFKKESSFISKEVERQLPGSDWTNGLWMRYKTIWWNGKRLLRLSADGKPKIIKDYYNNETLNFYKKPVNKSILYKANKTKIKKLENEAMIFIREIVKKYPNRKPIVSFSGGKDSAVVSHLVRKSLGKNNITHIFGDTTMEYPDTYNYIRSFKENYYQIPFLMDSNKHNFIEMCELLGPPSRINAWCCSVFKSRAIAKIVNEINGKDGVISFEGIRKRESSRRRNRNRTYINKKIVFQLSAYPILEWREIDVWIYLIVNDIFYNKAYKKGFTRVGCLYCPNNVPYNEYLISKYYPKKSEVWLNFLTEYARKIGKKDPEEYVLSGAWKMRVGKSIGKSNAYIEKRECFRDDTIYTYSLNKSFNEESIIQRFKPFGKLKKLSTLNDFKYLIENKKNKQSIFMLEGSLNFQKLKITLLSEKYRARLLKSIERQIRKFQVCVLCGACASVCPQGAINVDGEFKIDEKLCNGCKRCISTKYIPFSCIALNSTRQGKEFKSVNRI